jgi:hypothetical protein
MTQIDTECFCNLSVNIRDPDSYRDRCKKVMSIVYLC